MILSIITITYNAQPTLERTIQSVISQNDSRYEYIVVDGASTDGTMSIVDNNKEYFSKIISEKDNGLYDAMNKGLAQATGDYVCFLNSGDKFHDSSVVATILKYAEESGRPEIIYGETDIVDDDGHFLFHRRLKAPHNLSWRSFERGMVVCHQAFIVRRDIAPLYDLKYRFSADYDWCIRCMKSADHLVNTHSILVDYLSEGLTTSNRYTSLRERFVIMVDNYGLFKVVINHIWFAVRFLIANIKGKV